MYSTLGYNIFCFASIGDMRHTIMDSKKMILALDIGSAKIVAAIAQVQHDTLEIVSIGYAPSLGIKKGMVVDVQKTVQSITQALSEAAVHASYKNSVVYVGLSGAHIQSIFSNGVIAIKNQDVSKQDIQGALDSAQAVRLSDDQQLVHTFVQGFSIDHQDEIQDPIGMSGVRLELKVRLIAAGISATQNILKCIKRCQIEAQQNLIVNPFAASLAVLSADEKELGVVMVDIGAGTTDVVIYHKGVLRHIEVIAIGGDHVTNDIAIALRVPTVDAEEIKIKYGVCLQRSVNASEYIQVNDVGGFSKKASRQLLAVVIESRLDELLRLVQAAVAKSGFENNIATGYVFTGGCVQANGFIDLAYYVLQKNCRIGAPNYQGPLKELVNQPAFSSMMGTLMQAAESLPHASEQAPMHPVFNVSKRMWRWLVAAF